MANPGGRIPRQDSMDTIIRDLQSRNRALEQSISSILTGGTSLPPGSGDKTYHHVQSVTSAVWVVVHGLGKFPDVQAFTSANDEVEGDVFHNSTTQLTITFTAPFTGDAYCN